MQTSLPANDVTVWKRFPAFLVLAVLLTACGGDEGGGGNDVQGSLAEAERRIEEAGTNVASLKETRDWILEKVAADDPDALKLELLADDLRTDIGEKFRGLVDRLDASRSDAAAELRSWAEAIIDAEDAKPAEQRDELADALRPHMSYLWQLALEADPGNAALRKRLGYVEHTKDLASYLELPYVDEDSDIKKIETLIEQVAKFVEVDPNKKKWLPAEFKGAQDYREIDGYIAKLKAAHEKKLEDPFTRKAYGVLASTIEELRKKDSLKAYTWVGRVHYPYIFIVERDAGWDESDVAAKKAKQLDELIQLFHSAYSKTFNLSEITDPMPIVVFKRHNAYRQYAIGLSEGALGHYEHRTGRIVLSDQAERDTMYHEGTHQLVAYHTKIDTIANFATRSYWFQEGVAEYFGGTAVVLDKKTKELTYDLGVLQQGRINYWRSNEELAYSLWDLIGLTFTDRQRNIAEGKANKNLMVYSQGWFLVYFLYNFRVDSEDIVQISEEPKGKYKQQFLEYMRGEIEGKTGRQFFLECHGLWDKEAGKVDQAKWDAFELEFIRYYNWVNRKLAMKYHTENRKLIPWDEVENRRGRKVGEKIDDKLPDE